MPSFTSSVSNLEQVGPVVELTLAMSQAAVQAVQQAGGTAPDPIQIAAMIDTGASGTVIQEGLAQQLGLQQTGVVSVSTPSSSNVPCPQYAVRLLLPQGVQVEQPVIAAPMKGQVIQGLIGRDILRHGVLIYIGYENQFSLSF